MTNTIVKQLEDINQQEPRSFNARVPTVADMNLGMVDYATAFTRIEQSMKHLKRAVPNGQAEGCKIAAANLAQGMAETFAYLSANVPGFAEYVESVTESNRLAAHDAKHALTGV